MGENKLLHEDGVQQKCQLTGSHYYPEFTKRNNRTMECWIRMDKMFEVFYHRKMLALPLCDGCVACATGMCNQSARATTRMERQHQQLSAGTNSNRRFLLHVNVWNLNQQAGYPFKKIIKKLLIKTVNSRVLCTEKRVPHHIIQVSISKILCHHISCFPASFR